MLGTQTRGGRMVGADKSTEKWWHPYPLNLMTRVCVHLETG